MARLTASEAADIFRREPDRLLDVGAGRAAYRRVGEGPDVLFVHGWPVSGATFRKLLPHLADHVTCHVIDLPSAGSSEFDDDTPMSIAQHIESVRRVVDILELDQLRNLPTGRSRAAEKLLGHQLGDLAAGGRASSSCWCPRGGDSADVHVPNH